MSEGEAFALFDSDIGTCGLIWGGAGVRGLVLPERNLDETLLRIQRRHPQAAETLPAGEPARAIGLLQGLLREGRADLTSVTLDMGGLKAFHVAVYARVRMIPPGETMTYGDVALAVGSPTAARAVGEAMASNPFPLLVPCHRVVGAGDGRRPASLVGFSAHGGIELKRRLLRAEGAMPGGQAFLL